MGLTDESHDRAIAWNAVVYLATKLRIKAGILPKELDDLEGAYAAKVGEEAKAGLKFEVKCQSTNKLFYISDGSQYLGWNEIRQTTFIKDWVSYFETEQLATHCLNQYVHSL